MMFQSSIVPSKTRTSGFTLIELLVVIAIIALLAAILFPVFARARENARKSACLNNMKQLGLAMAQYTQDFDEMFPYGLTSSRRGIGWAGNLRPYTKSSQIFACPNDRPKGTPAVNATAISYAFSTWVAAKNLSELNNVSRMVSLVEVRTGFNVVMTSDAEVGDYKSPIDFGDNLAWLTTGGTDRCCLDQENTPPLYSTNVTGRYFDGAGSNTHAQNVGRHLDGANFLLVDGHVKWYRGAQVSYLATNADKTQISYYR